MGSFRLTVALQQHFSYLVVVTSPSPALWVWEGAWWAGTRYIRAEPPGIAGGCGSCRDIPWLSSDPGVVFVFFNFLFFIRVVCALYEPAARRKQALWGSV